MCGGGGTGTAAAEGKMAALCFPLLVINASTICTVRNLHICMACMCKSRQQERKDETKDEMESGRRKKEGQMQLQRGSRRWFINVTLQQFISECEGCVVLALSGAAGNRAEGLSA